VAQATALGLPLEDLLEEEARPSTDALRRLRRHRGATLGGVLLAALVLVALVGPLVTPYPPLKPSPADAMEPPSLAHPLGTDEIGRDTLSRIVAGAGLSLQVGLVASAVSVALGTTLGLVAGYRGGWTEAAIMRAVDVMLAMPGMLFAITIVAALGPSLVNVMLAVGLAGVPRFTRLIRGCVLSAKQNVYVDAARALGCGGARIVVRHILPNVVAPALVLATLNVGAAILTAASLSFLGLGAQPPTPEWGLMLVKGRDYLRTAWWLSTFPGLAIMTTVLAVNMLGDGLRDVLDPRLRV
jgi:peptide/nickel transport system permease protein